MLRPVIKIALLVSVFAGSAAPSPAADSAQDKTFLWRVSSKTTSVYLLGSIHAMKEDSYPLPPAMESAYDSRHLRGAWSPATTGLALWQPTTASPFVFLLCGIHYDL